VILNLKQERSRKITLVGTAAIAIAGRVSVRKIDASGIATSVTADHSHDDPL